VVKKIRCIFFQRWMGHALGTWWCSGFTDGDEFHGLGLGVLFPDGLGDVFFSKHHSLLNLSAHDPLAIGVVIKALGGHLRLDLFTVALDFFLVGLEGNPCFLVFGQ